MFKKQNKTKRIIAVILSVMTVFSCISLPAYAASRNINSVGSVASDYQTQGTNPATTNTSGIAGYDDTQNKESEYAEYSADTTATTRVFVTQVSNFSVIAPIVLSLNGKAGEINDGYYSVKVLGNIASNEIIVVEPEATFSMSSPGKDDISCDVTQEKSTFTYADGLRFDTPIETTGHIVANGMTAGRWNGSFNFNIELTEPDTFYSSIDLAVAEINNNTLGTNSTIADMPSEVGAACGVYKDNARNTYVIEAYDDLNDVQSIELNENCEIDLNNHTLTFAEGKYLSTEYDLSVSDGTINANNSKNAILTGSVENDAEINLSDLTINTTADSNNSSYVYGIDSRAKTNCFKNITINLSNSSTQNAVGILTRNATSTNNLSNIEINSLVNSGRIYGLFCKGSTLLTNSIIEISNKHLTQPAIGIINSNATGGVMDVSNVEIYTNADSNQTYSRGINNNAGSNMHISGLSINSITKRIVDYDLDGNGIANFGTLSIDEEKGQVFVEGICNTAIYTAPGSNTVINGGTYKSPNHGGIYCSTGSTGSCKINGGLFINNYNEYTSEQVKDAEPYGAGYFGCSNSSSGEWSVDIHNAKFINLAESEYTEKNKVALSPSNWSIAYYGRGIVSKSNSGYVPAKLNLYDCYIEARYQAILAQTGGEINLYGNTKAYGALQANGKLAIGGTVNDYTDNQITTIAHTSPYFASNTTIIGQNYLNSFRGDLSSLTITIPETTKWIMAKAFANCTSLKSIVIPNSVETISDGAFYNCSSLTNVTISDTLLKQLGDEGRINTVFEGCPCVDDLTSRYNNL